MRAADADILIVPGLGGSGPDHWQSRWERRLATARRVQQADWDRPDRGAWRDAVAAAIADARKPVVLVAHSLGVLSAVEAASTATANAVVGAFLVAPPDSEDATRIPQALHGFGPPTRGTLAFPSLLVASRNDPFATYERSAELARSWNSSLMDAGDSGHINADTGHGPWPEGLLLLSRLLREIRPAY